MKLNDLIQRKSLFEKDIFMIVKNIKYKKTNYIKIYNKTTNIKITIMPWAIKFKN